MKHILNDVQHASNMVYFHLSFFPDVDFILISNIYATVTLQHCKTKMLRIKQAWLNWMCQKNTILMCYQIIEFGLHNNGGLSC